MSQSEELTSSLNISTESTSLQAASVQGGVMEAETGSQRSQSRSSSNASQSRTRRVRPGSQSKRSVRAIVKALPRVGSSSSSQPIGPTIELHRHGTQQLYDGRTQEVHIHDQRTVSQEVHLHDGRTQSVHFGVSPEEFGMVVSEAQRLLDESQQKANAMEATARDIYSQACDQIQMLKNMVEELRERCGTNVCTIQSLTQQVDHVRVQLQEQISLNECIARLSESGELKNQTIAQLECKCASLEASLAALSAARNEGGSAVLPQETVPSRVQDQVGSVGIVSQDAGLQNQLTAIMDAIQSLGSRVGEIESSHNDAVVPSSSSPHRASGSKLVTSAPKTEPSVHQGTLLRKSPGSLVARGSPGGGDPEDYDDDDEDGIGDEDEEGLIEDQPLREKDIVDSRALHSSKLESIPNSAAEFRAWKNSLILLLSRLDISDVDYVVPWVNVAFDVESEIECKGSSGLVPRLDRWLAAELLKGMKGIPELQFKVQGYVENCTRDGSAPRGRAVLHMVSRHFDLDRFRGSLLTSQSFFQVELNGYSVSDLQEFSSQLMRVLNSIPRSQWPSQRMMGEFLFHKLRTVRRLERIIDEVKRSPETSSLRDFDFLWTKLQEFLVEEREDINARSIEQSLRSPKKKDVSPNVPKPSKAKAIAAPAKTTSNDSQAESSVRAAPASPAKSKPKDPPAKKEGKGGQKGKTLTAEQKAKTPCIFFQMQTGCLHGDKCQYLHEKRDSSSASQPKTKPKGPPPKAAPKLAAVALVAALSSMVSPVDGYLEFAADSGAGRHLISQEALALQGLGKDAVEPFLRTAGESLKFHTGGGERHSNMSLGLGSVSGDFGTANHFVLQGCPFVRSIGQDVADGMGFIWLPGQTPFYVKKGARAKVVCNESDKIFASKVHEYVPFFNHRFNLIPGVPGEVAEPEDFIVETPPELAELAIEAVEVPDLRSDEAPVDSSVVRSSNVADFVELGPEDAPMPRLPVDLPERAVEARASALGIDHQLTHCPKNPTCDVCNRARLYSKRVKSHRVADEASDLPKPDAFGKQLACDHLIVFKSAKSGRDHAVLIVGDVFSKVLQAYPVMSKDASQIAAHLKHFVGLKSDAFTVVKSDAAAEILRAVTDNGWLPESSIPGRFPHNSGFEREVRTFQEICRSVFLQAGFSARPQLWPQACQYVATAMSAFIKPEDGETRWKTAFGDEFLGPKYLLGQLGFVRTKEQGKSKFSPNAEPAIFVGWRLDFGLRYRGVLYFVLYSHLRENMSSYPVSQFHDSEVYFKEEIVFPLLSAAEAALRDLGDPTLVELHDIDSIPVPFVDSELEKKTRRVYITYSRMKKIGPTRGCKGCEKGSYNRNAECVARFEAEFGVRDGDSVVEPPFEGPGELPDVDSILLGEDEFEYEQSIAPDTPEGSDHDVVVVDDEYTDLLELDDVPECPPAEGLAAIASIACDVARAFPQDDVQPMFQDVFDQGGLTGCVSAASSPVMSSEKKQSKHGKGKHKSVGKDILFEFACAKDSNLGKVGKENGVKVIRLCKEDIDLEDPGSISQLAQQVKAVPGCSIHCSIECKPWSQWQRLNKVKYPRLAKAIEQDRAASEKLLQQFIRIANICLDNGGDCSFEWPRFCSGWALPSLQQWIVERELHSATFDGCAVGVEADGSPARKPWRFVTSSKRLAMNLGALRCDHKKHAPLQGKWTRLSAFYPRPLCNIMLQSLFPHVVNQHVHTMPCVAFKQHEHRKKIISGFPSIPLDVLMMESGCHEMITPAYVHKLLDRSDWKNRPEVLPAIESEKNGLLANGTWDENKIRSKADVVNEARRQGKRIHIGALMIIVSIKGFEKPPEEWVVKARIVFRGDAVRDEDNQAAVFDEINASAPSSLAGLNFVVGLSLLEGNTCSTSDCVKAYVQSLLDTSCPTYVLLPPELVPKAFKHVYQPVAPLIRSLYGHPLASASWQNHLLKVLTEKLGGRELEQQPSCYYFEKYGLAMSVYVDDLTVSGPAKNHDEFWQILRQRIQLDDPAPLTKVLGRNHLKVHDGLALASGDFAKTCVTLYEEVSGRKAKPARTPHVDEGSLVSTDDETRGCLASSSAKLVMKYMWLGRISRPDLLVAINTCASTMTNALPALQVTSRQL